MQMVKFSAQTSLSTLQPSFIFVQWKLWILTTVAILLFCQLYFSVSGFTIRSEDILLSIFWVFSGLLSLSRLRLPKLQDPLAISILLWMLILITGVIVTLFQVFTIETKKDAVINSYRLILMASLFYIAYYISSYVCLTLRSIFKTVFWFSFLTTAISLLQIGYWDGWLPLQLPSFLTEYRDTPHFAVGREIFALFISDNNAHVWSVMLTMQIFTILFMNLTFKRPVIIRTLVFLYIGLLIMILLRLSVRNSILGFIGATIGWLLIQVNHNKYLFNRIVKSLAIISGVIIGGATIMYILPESYIIDRIRQAVPRIEGGMLIFDNRSNIYGRFEYWQIAWEIFLRQPLIGGGFYSYAERSVFWTGDPIVHAHNSYIHTLAELGIIGIIGLAWLGWQLFLLLQFLWRTKTNEQYIVVGRNILTCTLLFLSITALFGNPFFSTNQIGFAAILAGCLARYRVEYMRTIRSL